MAGSRMDDFTPERRTRAREQVIYLIDNLDPARHIIVAGGAPGIDTAAYNYAQNREFEAYELNAAWYLGKHAGFLRNDFMVRIGDSTYTFWDGESHGTEDTISRARRAGNLRGIIDI